MLNKMTSRLDFHSDALLLRAEKRQPCDFQRYCQRRTHQATSVRRLIFAKTLQAAQGENGSCAKPCELPAPAMPSTCLCPPEKFGTVGKGPLGYALASQPSLDNNTVDLDRERANFVTTPWRYEATLRFLNGQYQNHAQRHHWPVSRTGH